jgi:ketosteroid isomerase-like protein
LSSASARCADAVWRKDTVAFANLFVPDGVRKAAGLTAEGRAEIARIFDTLAAVNERILMRFAKPIIELDGTVASARTYTIEHVKRLDGVGESGKGFGASGKGPDFMDAHFGQGAMDKIRSGKPV